MYKVLFNVKATALCAYLYTVHQLLAMRIFSSLTLANNGVRQLLIDLNEVIPLCIDINIFN